MLQILKNKDQKIIYQAYKRQSMLFGVKHVMNVPNKKKLNMTSVSYTIARKTQHAELLYENPEPNYHQLS